MLALKLLENDLESEDKFINNVINYLEDIKNNSEEKSIVPEEDTILFKILSFMIMHQLVGTLNQLQSYLIRQFMI